MKVLAFDTDHVILYQCLDHRDGRGECPPDMTRVDVLGRSSSEELSPELFSWVVASLKQSCVEVGDMEHVRHSGEAFSTMFLFLILFFNIYYYF